MGLASDGIAIGAIYMVAEGLWELQDMAITGAKTTAVAYRMPRRRSANGMTES